MEDDAELFRPSTLSRPMPFSEHVADRDCCSRSDWGRACCPLLAGPLMASSAEGAALGLGIGGAWDVPAAAGNTGCGSWRLLAGVCSPSEPFDSMAFESATLSESCRILPGLPRMVYPGSANAYQATLKCVCASVFI